MNQDGCVFAPDHLDYQLNISSSSALSRDDTREPEDLLSIFEGQIVAYDVVAHPIEVGHIQFDRVHVVTALNEGENLVEALDAGSYDLASMQSIFDARSGIYNDSIAQKFMLDTQAADLVFINRLEILPPFRGIGLTSLILQEIFRRHSDVPFIACEARPTQCLDPEGPHSEWTERLELIRYPQDQRQAVDTLTEYLKRSGFVSIPSSTILLAPNPALTHMLVERQLPKLAAHTSSLH